jgi:hypothetical protein
MLLYIAECVISILLVLMTGKLFLSFVQIKLNSPNLHFFIELISGFYGVISVYAIYVTGGLTISSLFVLWILIWLIRTSKLQKPNFSGLLKLNTTILIEVLIIQIGLIILNYFKFFWISSSIPIVISSDGLSDVTRAIFMNYTGVENTNTNFIQIPQGTLPYHYFEAWAVGFFSKLFHGNFWLTQVMLFQPIILSIIYTGFRCFTSVESKRWISILFGMSLFCASGILNDSILQIRFFEWTLPLKNNVIDEPWWTRLSVLYPIILLAFYLLTSKKYLHSVFCILSIPFLSVTPAIPLIASIVMLSSLAYLFCKKPKKQLIGLIFIPFSTALLYQFFYFLFKDRSEFISLPNFSQIFNELKNPHYVSVKIKMMIEKLTQTIVLYSPFILLLLIGTKRKQLNPMNWTNENKITFAFVLIIATISLLMWQLLYFMFGSSFFFYYTIIPFLNVIFVIILYKNFSSKNRKIQFFISLGIIFLLTFFIVRSYNTYYLLSNNFSQRYSSEYLLKINELWRERINEKNLALGVELEDHSEIVHPFYNDGICLSGSYMYSIANAPVLISLSRADIPEKQLNSTNNARNFTSNSSFYQFVHNPENKNINIDSLKRKFIRKYSIRYGIVSPKGKIPKELSDLVDFIVKDNVSKEQFVIFKN